MKLGSSLPRVASKNSSRKVSLSLAENLMKSMQIDVGLVAYQKQIELIRETRDPVTFQIELKQILSYLNNFAMKLLEKKKTQELSIMILQWIIEQSQLEKIPSQRCISLNNLGCAYRRMSKVQLACNSIEQALNLINTYPEIENKSITYLDLTAVLSQMGLHDRALKIARDSVKVAKQEFDPTNQMSIKYLSMAYYNLAVELEATNQIEESNKQFKAAMEFTELHLGKQDLLYEKFIQSYQRSKEKLIMQSSHQSQNLMKTLLIQNKRFDLSDESVVNQTPLQQTKKFIIKKQNFMEDQIQESNIKTVRNDRKETVKEKESQKPTVEQSQQIQQQYSQQLQQQQEQSQQLVISKAPLGNQLDQIGVLEWSNSEPSDNEINRLKDKEKQIQLRLNNANIPNKDQRMNFLNKMNVFTQDEGDLLQKELMIIREVENQIYNVAKIKKIQAQYRMKDERKRYLKLRQHYKEQGKLMPIDELKLKKFQRFIRRKLAQLKVRRATKKIIWINKLKIYPQKRTQALNEVISCMETQRVYSYETLHRRVLNQKQFQKLRQSLIYPPIVNDRGQTLQTKVSQGFIFTISIQYPDQVIIKFCLVPLDKKQKKDKANKVSYDIDTGQVITAIALLEQYIDKTQDSQIEESDIVQHLRKLKFIGQQFISVQEHNKKLIVKNSCDNNQQFKNQLEKVAYMFEKLIIKTPGGFKIIGITDFEYDTTAREQEAIQFSQPPLSLQSISPEDEKKIIKLQSVFKGIYYRTIYRARLKQKRKILEDKQFITHDKGHLQFHVVLETKRDKNGINQRQVCCMIDKKLKKKTNDLEYNPQLFEKLGEVNKETMYDIFEIDLTAFTLQYSQEALYWIEQIRKSKYRQGLSISRSGRNNAVIKIQKTMRGYLVRRQVSVQKEQMLRMSYEKNYKSEILLRRANVFGDGKTAKACLANYILITEEAKQQSSMMNQKEYQSVKINFKIIEHMYSFEKVIPYFQRLFYLVDRSQLMTIANRQLDYAKLAKFKKEGYKVETKGFDEIQGELLSSNDEFGENEVIRDLTIDYRTELNRRYREKFLEQTPQIKDNPDFDLASKIEVKKHSNYAKYLQKQLKSISMFKYIKIQSNKHVDIKDEVSVSNYVKNFLPTTEYGNMPEVVPKQFSSSGMIKQESIIAMARVQNTRNSIIIRESLLLYDDIAIVSGVQILLKILFYESMQQIVVLGQSEDGTQQYKASISRASLLGGIEINFEYLKSNITDIIIKQLQLFEQELVFKLDPTLWSQITLDNLNQEKSQQSFTQSISQIQLLEKQSAVIQRDSQVVLLDIKSKEPYYVEYEFNKNTQDVCIIYYKDASNLIRINIPITQFDSPYFTQAIQQYENNSIIQTLKPVIFKLHNILEIYGDNFTNFDQIKHILPVLLKNQFLGKLQGIIKVKRLREQFKLYRQMKNLKLVVAINIINNFSHYIKLTYVLIKAERKLLIIAKEITYVTAFGQVVEQTSKTQNKIKLRVKHFCINLNELQDMQLQNKKQQDIMRFDFTPIINYQQMKTLEYYRQLFGPMIQLIEKNLSVNFQKFTFDLGINLKLTELDVKKIKTQTKVLHKYSVQTMIKAVTHIKNCILVKSQQDWFKRAKEKQAQLKKQNRYIGKFIKRSFQRIQTDDKMMYYIVNIYSKPYKLPGQFRFTFELIPAFKEDRYSTQYNKKTSEEVLIQNKMRGYYVYEPNKLTNQGATPIHDYLMSLIYVEQKIIRFKGYIPQNLDDFEEEQQQESQQKGQQIIQEEVDEKLINHEEKPDALYNVVYTGQKQLAEQKDAITIQVNLKNVRKLYPRLNPRDKETMKEISQSLINGIKVEGGQIQTDQSKIVSSFINVKQSEFKGTFVQSYIQDSKVTSRRGSRVLLKPRVQKPFLKQDLVKNTVTFAGEKYLIVIYYVERKINKIQQATNDKVFQDFEQIFSIQANNLNKIDNEAIIWELSIEEAKILSRETSRDKISLQISKRLQVLNNQFIYLCFDEQDLLKVRFTNQPVILFDEKTLRPIQERFRNRNYRRNYSHYRQVLANYSEIKRYQEDGKTIYERVFQERVALFDLRDLGAKNCYFIVICYEDEFKKIRFIAWNCDDDFRIYDLDIPKQRYAAMYMEEKIRLMRALSLYVQYVPEKQKVLFQNPTVEQIQEHFDEDKRLSISQSPKQMELDVFSYDEAENDLQS